MLKQRLQEGETFMHVLNLLRPKNCFGILLTIAIFIAGCSTFGGGESNIILPTLIQKTTLPPVPWPVNPDNFCLQLELLISRDGKVLHVDLRNTSGSKAWDSLAIQRIMQWKYSPATYNGTPIQVKIAQTARVVVTQPVRMRLSEIVCTTLAEANSIYSALEGGAPFDSLARVHSISSTAASGGYLGEVNINNFEDEIESALKDLIPGEFTHPLHLGQDYVIYEDHDNDPGLKDPLE